MTCCFTKKLLLLIFCHKVLCKTLFVKKSINNLLPSLFNNWFLFSSDERNYETSWFSFGNLHERSNKTNTYGKNSIVVRVINAWNNSQKLLKICFRHLSPNKIKNILSEVYLQSIEMNCQLSDISSLCLIILQILKTF